MLCDDVALSPAAAAGAGREGISGGCALVSLASGARWPSFGRVPVKDALRRVWLFAIVASKATSCHAATGMRSAYRRPAMGHLSIWHWMIVLAIVLVLFGGGGKIPKLMKDLGEGVTAFKKGLNKDEAKTAATADATTKQIEDDGTVAGSTVSHKDTVVG
jgi:sec-independent protein translocase protein TatA